MLAQSAMGERYPREGFKKQQAKSRPGAKAEFFHKGECHLSVYNAHHWRLTSVGRQYTGWVG